MQVYASDVIVKLPPLKEYAQPRPTRFITSYPQKTGQGLTQILREEEDSELLRYWEAREDHLGYYYSARKLWDNLTGASVSSLLFNADLVPLIISILPLCKYLTVVVSNSLSLKRAFMIDPSRILFHVDDSRTQSPCRPLGSTSLDAAWCRGRTGFAYTSEHCCCQCLACRTTSPQNMSAFCERSSLSASRMSLQGWRAAICLGCPISPILPSFST
jgi:hypothetical protein